MRRNQVLVIGSSEDSKYNETAFEIGAYIAVNNWVLITGGRTGIMKSASKGAYDSGGTVIGILPGSEFDEANPYCSVVIPTGLGHGRNMINVLSADIIVSIGGSYGTLNELSYASLFNKHVICCVFTEGFSSSYPEFPENVINIHAAYNTDDIKKHLDNFFISK